MKESMEIGREWDPVWKNKWPKEADAPDFKQTMLQFFQVTSSVDSVRGVVLYVLERHATNCT